MALHAMKRPNPNIMNFKFTLSKTCSNQLNPQNLGPSLKFNMCQLPSLATSLCPGPWGPWGGLSFQRGLGNQAALEWETSEGGTCWMLRRHSRAMQGPRALRPVTGGPWYVLLRGRYGILGCSIFSRMLKWLGGPCGENARVPFFPRGWWSPIAHH